MVNSGNRRPIGKKSAGSIAVAVLIALYALLQPRLNQQFGWDLPGLGNPSSHSSAVETEAEVAANRSSIPAASSPVVASEPDLVYGLLSEIRRDEYLSPQGLQYVAGSAEGHRLEHLRRHTIDDPSRPGKHGVFDGGMEGALVTIDQAYERAKKEQRTTKQIDRDRTIYTVDLGRRVGYVGGIDGNRARNPMARRVKLVLEGSMFITAYPL